MQAVDGKAQHQNAAHRTQGRLRSSSITTSMQRETYTSSLCTFKANCCFKMNLARKCTQ
jgi:hypothetical protein